MFVATRWGVQICADDGPPRSSALPDHGRVLGVCLGGLRTAYAFRFQRGQDRKRKVKTHALGRFTRG